MGTIKKVKVLARKTSEADFPEETELGAELTAEVSKVEAEAAALSA